MKTARTQMKKILNSKFYDLKVEKYYLENVAILIMQNAPYYYIDYWATVGTCFHVLNLKY